VQGSFTILTVARVRGRLGNAGVAAVPSDCGTAAKALRARGVLHNVKSVAFPGVFVSSQLCTYLLYRHCCAQRPAVRVSTNLRKIHDTDRCSVFKRKRREASMAAKPQDAIIESEKGTRHYDEKADLESIKPVGGGNVDYTGSVAKTDPREIALVRKIDWRLMVRKIRSGSLLSGEHDCGR
jgi:hypothetical protein